MASKNFLVKLIAQKCHYDNNLIIDIALSDMDSEGKVTQLKVSLKKIKDEYRNIRGYSNSLE